MPFFIENPNRVLPKGEVLPAPMLCTVSSGEPLRLAQDEAKPQFLTRAREALLALRPR